MVSIIDLFSIQPIDREALRAASRAAGGVFIRLSTMTHTAGSVMQCLPHWRKNALQSTNCGCTKFRTAGSANCSNVTAFQHAKSLKRYGRQSRGRPQQAVDELAFDFEMIPSRRQSASEKKGVYDTMTSPSTGAAEKNLHEQVIGKMPYKDLAVNVRSYLNS